MVAQRKQQQEQDSELEARLHRVLGEIDSLPFTMLAVVERRIADRIEQQTSAAITQREMRSIRSRLALLPAEESPLLRRALERPDENLPVPTDEELEQWRDEYLKEKYG
jgi:hypothetical protein